jgi:Na+/H+ antiporter NhaD/arsenite permease-like protein
MMNHKLLVGIVFGVVYLYLVFGRRHRALASWIGASLIVLISPVGPLEALRGVNLNVLGIFAGTLLLAELFVASGVPLMLADRLAASSRNAGMALLKVCILSGFLSCFVENVATVLIVAPVALGLASRLKISPTPLLVGIAISSNLQGSATLIGDPPSMILAAWQKMTFNDFFFYKGRPGIFFAVELGALASFVVLYLLFRGYRQPVGEVRVAKVRTWVPTVLLTLMVIALALGSRFDPDFRYLGGATCMLFGAGGMLWQWRRGKRKAATILRRRFDLETTFFLAGIFVLVHCLSLLGIVEDVALTVQKVAGSSPIVLFSMVVAVSVFVSGFVDNVPYVMAMIPVSSLLAQGAGIAPEVLVFALVVSACLGGNITHVGAAANIVAVGMLRKRGQQVDFWSFSRIGLPFTLAATSAAAVFLWFVWR